MKKELPTSKQSIKADHIQMTERAKTAHEQKDDRFDYEPILSTHPTERATLFRYFLGKPILAPIWISSMTGGTQEAKKINTNLAIACKEFGLGMGLGSCRCLLESDDYFADFAMRPYLGDQSFYANLGIAQLINLIQSNQLTRIIEVVKKLEADGLIIHVNPIQEWLQGEGDPILEMTPYRAIEMLLGKVDMKIIVKEVGQGMGPESLQKLLSLPLAAIEFGAFGGTNFAKLEDQRNRAIKEINPLCFVGHTATEMIDIIHTIAEKENILCKEFIVSGGVKSYLDGYYYNEKLQFNSVYGQASAFLKYAREDYDKLASFLQSEIDGYKFAMRYLKIKPTSK